MRNWKFSTHYSSICMVLDEQYLWGQIICRIWLPSQNVIVRVSEADLKPLHAESISETEEFRISYIATAAKIAELLENTSKDNDSTVLLAPMESNVIPLPHQLHALSRAISGDRDVTFLLMKSALVKPLKLD